MIFWNLIKTIAMTNTQERDERGSVDEVSAETVIVTEAVNVVVEWKIYEQ